MQVEVVSPERVLYEGDAEMIIARTVGGGDVAFMAGHVPFLGALETWPLQIQLQGGGEQAVAVHGGFIEISHDKVTVLSDIAELADQIDVPRAQAALERTEGADDDDDERAAARQRAEVRLQVASSA